MKARSAATRNDCLTKEAICLRKNRAAKARAGRSDARSGPKAWDLAPIEEIVGVKLRTCVRRAVG
jgi:hypothetical protein